MNLISLSLGLINICAAHFKSTALLFMKQKINILLADDDKDDRFFFEKALHDLPFEIEFSAVEDGEKLMAYLIKNSRKLPDVLFLDLNMPRKNGSECLVEIKKHAKLKDLPIIIYSTSLHDDVADFLFGNGANYYIQKTDFTNLSKLLDKALSIITQTRALQPTRDKFILSMTKLA